MTELGLLGPENTFHDIARQQFLPHLSYRFYNNFNDIFKALKAKEIEKALIATENNASGLVGDNLVRIKNTGYSITESFQLSIHLCLGSIKPITLERIKKIYSHPMAIKETQNFFRKYSHITFIASTSTAGAIQELKNNKDQYAAVIASKEAMEKDDLLILSQNIEDHSDNKTTFALVENA